MSQAPSLPSELARGARAAVADVKPWVEPAARLGHAARGVVYVLIGIFTIAADVGIRARLDGSEGVFATLGRAPFGKILLATIAIGLVYYALWELCRAIADPEHEARGKIVTRVGWLATAVIFGSLAWAAFQLVFGHDSPGDDEAARNSVASVLSRIPYGAWVLAIVGAAVLITGLVFIKRGWTADLERHIDMMDLPPRLWHAIYALARFGMVARGVLIAVIGVFILIAAWTHDPDEAIGFAGALRVIGHQAYGPSLLAGVALGLVSYGVYELLVAWRGRFYVR
jgi:hypothetical protein